MKTSLAALIIACTLSLPAVAQTRVPFVGCPADGQQGPEPAPHGQPVALRLDPKLASRLAFYKSNYDDGVLAPRGWHCIALAGSDGNFLVVSKTAASSSYVLDTGAV